MQETMDAAVSLERLRPSLPISSDTTLSPEAGLTQHQGLNRLFIENGGERGENKIQLRKKGKTYIQ